jgi:hypothetical protein
MDFSQVPAGMFAAQRAFDNGPPAMRAFDNGPAMRAYDGQAAAVSPMMMMGGGGSGGGIARFCRANAAALMVAAVILIALIIGFLVYRTRHGVMGASAPYAEIVQKIADPAIKADAQEVQYLYQVAKRPNIRTMLQETIEGFRAHIPGAAVQGSAAKERTEDHGSFEVVGLTEAEARATGGFEPI